MAGPMKAETTDIWRKLQPQNCKGEMRAERESRLPRETRPSCKACTQKVSSELQGASPLKTVSRTNLWELRPSGWDTENSSPFTDSLYTMCQTPSTVMGK